MIERIERAHHMYDNGPKPKHYGDKSIVDMEESQLYSSQPIDIPVVKPVVQHEVKPKAPERPLNDIIAENAELRRQRDIADMERKFGRGGLVDVAKRYI